jgi:hypothetical protein
MCEEDLNMNRSLRSLLSVLLMLVGLPAVLAQDSGWPRTVPLEQGMVTIYAPQVDAMDDDIIHFRAALAYRATGDSEPVFGAAWFESRVEIDSARRIVHPTDLKVTETRFPAGTADVQSELSAVLAQQSPAWNLDFSLDELQASLKKAEAESIAAQNLNTAPPRIIYRDHPALLIIMDGEPVLREIENSPYEAVINTPYPLIYDGRHYYLNAAKGVWYSAVRATGPYQFEIDPPVEIAAMVNAGEPEPAAGGQPAEAITAANAPEIVVSVEPAELIVTEGPAAFVPLVDDLLVLQNSDDDVFMHVSSQKFYIVLAGRWYQASSLNGPWAYQPADRLPVAFANIPRESDQADSRVYVAGTEEAREAVLDAHVPQTAAVTRGEVDMEVEYDGDPVFQPVDGTDLVYIENTGSTVLLSDDLYYLVEDGVWYVSVTPNGPWQVSTHRPAQVETILPTSPVYNVKYVHVYDSTPNVVYVGYTPGYTGSYVYHNTIFYGSGWYYQPWVSPYYYYPRHSTWGFNVSYNPWSGWGFGLSWGWGPFSVGYYSGGYWHHSHYWHHRHYGHWGPHGYRPRPVHYGRHGHGYNRYGHNRYGRGGDGRSAYGRNAGGGHRSNPYLRNGNLYRDDAQRARVAETRDNPPRAPGVQRSEIRQANYTAAIDRRERNFDGRKKAGRNRAEPVSPGKLRMKADVRDANFNASRTRLFADDSGNVYRKTDRRSDRNDAVSRSNPPAKTTKNRTKPEPPRSAKAVSQNGDRVRRRADAETGVRQARRSSGSAPPQQAQTRIADKRVADTRARQRSSPVVDAPARRAQVKNSSRARQRLPREVNTPVRQAQPGTVRAKAVQQPPRLASAPKARRNDSRPGPQPQSARHGDRRDSAPAPRAPRGSTRKTGSRRYGPDRGMSKRPLADIK